MRHHFSPVVLLFAAAGTVILAWGAAGGLPEHAAALQAAESSPSQGPNLSLWVPEQELRVWDPVNPNVNPIPWRVFGPLREREKRSAAFRHTAIDQRVRVEGLAWGYEVETDVPTSRVLFEGGTVLVDGVDFNQPETRGKPVRVEGILRLKTIQPMRVSFLQQFPNYYCIESEAFEIIDQVTDPKVVLVP